MTNNTGQITIGMKRSDYDKINKVVLKKTLLIRLVTDQISEQIKTPKGRNQFLQEILRYQYPRDNADRCVRSIKVGAETRDKLEKIASILSITISDIVRAILLSELEKKEN